MSEKIPLGLTFDDVLLVPQYSEISSRSDIDLRTRLTKNITLNIPLISSNMDTVTESTMAIAMARSGGIGIIHRYCTIDSQAEMVRKVKRAESYIIHDPYTVDGTESISAIRERIKATGVRTYIVTDSSRNVCGILTNRDMLYAKDGDLVKDRCTTQPQLICGIEGIDMERARSTMYASKIQKLPILSEGERKLVGLICLKDIERIKQRPLANLDSRGRLRCGAAIGVKDDVMERVTKLVHAEVDVLVIDIAHGHSKACIDTIKMVKAQFPNIDIIAGNIATKEGAEDLIKAGADGIKLGIGSGAICITRIVSGAGVPQLTALLEASVICKKYGIPLISDGGNRNSGNICKALAAGAQCVMLGRMIAGSDESPGNVQLRDNKRVKIFRGMASYEANLSNALKNGTKEPHSITSHIEGVQGYVPYTGPLIDTLTQICNGIRSGVSYCGSSNIEELQSKAKFIRITERGSSESGVHDIIV